eukprot:8924478-Lingulodinium_polyedra.AAC.1
MTYDTASGHVIEERFVDQDQKVSKRLLAGLLPGRRPTPAFTLLAYRRRASAKTASIVPLPSPEPHLLRHGRACIYKSYALKSPEFSDSEAAQLAIQAEMKSQVDAGTF